MARVRLTRDEFFGKLTGLDEAGLQKALWTLYWRGSGPMRERIEALIDPTAMPAQPDPGAALPDAGDVLAEVTEFAALARKGAYLAGDRRVSPKARTRWRFTFKRLADLSVKALASDDVASAATATATLIDLACETLGYDYFRSDDPMEAARFVVSDAAAALWTATRREDGFTAFAARAAPELVRWESRYGWTRRGDGRVAEHETTLADMIAKLLPTPDAWSAFTDHYLLALDAAETAGRHGRRHSPNRRAEDLSAWHELVLEHLDGDDGRLDRLVHHPALAGPERTFLQARLAERRGDREDARRLVRTCLDEVPGHRDFQALAEQIGAHQPRTNSRRPEVASTLAPGRG